MYEILQILVHYQYCIALLALIDIFLCARARFDQCVVFYLLFGKVPEAESQFGLVFGSGLFAVKEVLEEDVGHLDGALVDRGPDTALQDHL